MAENDPSLTAFVAGVTSNYGTSLQLLINVDLSPTDMPFTIEATS